MRLICAILFLFAAPGLPAESWTNAAGHSVQAELVGRKGDMLTLKRPDGSLFTIRRSALKKECHAAVDKKFPPQRTLTHAEIVQQRQIQRMEQLKDANE